MTSFHAHAIGEQGGVSNRSGRTTATAELRLERSDDWLTARGEIRDGAPWLVVKLGDALLFDGRWPGTSPPQTSESEPRTPQIIDLMEALKASLAASRPLGVNR